MIFRSLLILVLFIPILIQKSVFGRVQSPGVEIIDNGASINSIRTPLSMTQPRELSIPPKNRFLNQYRYTGCTQTSTTESESQNHLHKKIRVVSQKISEGTFYLGAGAAFGAGSLLAGLGWGASLMTPWTSTVGNECLLLSHLCATAAHRSFAQLFKERRVTPSQHSWQLNKLHLSQVPAFSDEKKQLLQFLEKRWLAKSTGIFSAMADWVYPCFGYSVQVHPMTTHSYARDPGIQISQTYQNRVDAWKQSLPHPQHFPLILTRPSDLQDYLPSYLPVPRNESIQTTIERLIRADSKVILDVTHIFPNDNNEWHQTWEAYGAPFFQACKKHDLDPQQIVCIQRVKQEGIGGIRILPLGSASSEEIDLQHRFLLEWVSRFGLSANRVELDRWPLHSNDTQQSASIERPSKKKFVAYLNSIDWNSSHPQKALMLKGTLQVLKGLFDALSENQWNEITLCPTRSSVAQLSFQKITDEFELLVQEKSDTPFFETASHVEQIHANLSSLLEIFTPFTADDFPAIYRDLLTSIPRSLKPLTSCALHASGMTSFAGIFKAVEKSLGRRPRVLYGENTYFECITAAHLVSNASLIHEAVEEDWKEVDLILAQFNPVLRRIDMKATEYRVEKVAEVLHKSFNAGRTKPLTLAVDCTIDFIDSPRVGKLLDEFQEEIEKGSLNIICYRSGLKFDLFGMDNYCGAPFYMIHNRDSKWASFDALLSDPVLQTDRLSLNWFCLAYQSAAPELELYRKQIFDNTRALLTKIPSRLLHDEKASYRIVPVENGADPAFIDIKIFGPYHQMKSSALVSGCLYTKCMEGGHPIFFRPSIGFYHPNFSMIFHEKCSTIRLTLGLDPAQIDLLAQCFEMIDALNGSSWQTLLDKHHWTQ